ncbi:hypothetical protein PoMZ_12549 [Pyricularia oryzae]|uniref:Uncharacterized protein n=1 Tax=Pyricularia oryzae TaxID=318829 RepID=A0A4P7NSX9_PYROR|nr:hypothetical protein PoMZ_12549 [Pyricularia oryzae]
MTLCEIVVKRTVSDQGAINKSGMLSIRLLIPGKVIATTLTTIKTRSFETKFLLVTPANGSFGESLLVAIVKYTRPRRAPREIKYQIRYKETYSQIAARPVHVFVRFIPRFGTVLCKLEKDVRDIQGSWCWGNPHATTYQIQRLVANANTAAFASELIYLGQPLHFGAATGDPGLAGIKNSGLSHLWLTWLKKCKKVAQVGK